MGLADILLEQPTVDINFRDEKGMTLVAIACSTPIEEAILDQLKYLVTDKKADCTIKDVGDATPVSRDHPSTSWAALLLSPSLIGDLFYSE